MKRFYLILLILFPVLLSALSVEKGNLKIVADDETGGYLCYARLSGESPWFPLMVESFTSSYVQIKVNGEDIIPGESKDFTLRFETSDASLAAVFEGDGIVLTEEIFIREDRRGTAYFDLSIQLENSSGDSVEGGIRKVLDTTFIRGNSHFLIGRTSVEEEEVFEKGNIPGEILSPGSLPGQKLYVKTAFDDAPGPDRLLLINWNRLDQSSWDYEPAAGTNFNALPFSINDSALGVVWQPLVLKSGASLNVRLAMGPRDFTLEEEPPAEETEPGAAAVPADPALALLHLEEQLEYIDFLLEDVEDLIGRIDEADNEDILSLEDRLDILEQKKRDYERLR